MKILVHHHKYGDQYYDLSREVEAWSMMFEELREFGCYTKAEIKASREGLEQLKTLLRKHKDREYEGFSIEETRN